MHVNNSKFIYVFSADDKDKLVSFGYNLIKADERQNIYVFENSGTYLFNSDDMRFVLSDMLTY